LDPSFLGMPDISPALFGGLVTAAFATSFIGIVTGTAGGLMMLAILAMVFPPALLIPMHTLVQLGTGGSRVIMMRRYVLYPLMLPFIIGSAVGAAIGAQIFVSLPTAVLQGFLGAFIVFVTWMPDIGRFGPERGRFATLGFLATFLGMFVSATGTLVAPFVAAASPDRRNHAATLAACMSTTHIMKVVAFFMLGVAIATYAPLIVAMVAGGVLGNYIGGFALNAMREEWFRTLFKVLMTVMALRLLWVAAASSGWF
jgi:uncharacterized membrane protein YfcA